MKQTIHRAANSADADALRQIYTACFEEKEEAVELFFNRNKDFAHAYISLVDGKPAASLYLIDCELNGCKANYLFAAGTLPEYRRKGIMSGLIEFALDDAGERGDRYSLLFPASRRLYRFYRRLGYTVSCSAARVLIEREELERTASAYESGEADFQRLQKECFKKDFLLQSDSFMRFASEYYALYGTESLLGSDFFALCESDGRFAHVYYAAYTDFSALARALLEKTSAEFFYFTFKADNPLLGGNEPELCGLLYKLDRSERVPENIYIGMTLN